MLYGLHGLRHHTIIGRDHKYHDVRDSRAPGTHGRKRSVSWSIDKRQLLAARCRLVGANMLGNSARLAVGHLQPRIAYGIKQ